MMLTARAAASRFLRKRRRLVHKSADQWLPLAMRWRQARRLRRRSMPHTRTTLVQNTWQPHFHWHLGLRAGDWQPRNITTRILSSTRESKRLLTTIEHRWHTPAASIVATSSRTDPQRRQWRRAPGIRMRQARSESTAINRERPSPTVEQPRNSRASSGATRTRVLSRVPNVERTFSTMKVTPHHHDVSMRWRVRRESTGPIGERQRAGVTVNPAFRPAEIAWRAASKTLTSDNPAVPQRSVDAMMHAPQQGAAPSVAISVVPATEPKRPAVLQISDLDASVVDRLTDDVIRRVERRVRIERERRGM